MVATAAGATTTRWACGAAPASIRFGLTPVFLSNDLDLLTRLKSFLTRHTGFDVTLVQRRTYEEITSLLLSDQLTAAWICGYPYVVYREQLGLIAAPVWQGRPLYQSYVIVDAERPAARLEELSGDIHAFSDPNSNSGYIVTRAALAGINRGPEEFFGRTFFTYGHRNVVRAVASGLAQSGSVDGYVWDVLSEVEPDLTRRTRVLLKSDWLGFPPIACPKSQQAAPQTIALQDALLAMAHDADGADVLRQLRLDGFTLAEPSLFDGIAANLARIRRAG